MEENKNNKKVYSYDEVYEATLKYFNGDDLATTVWIKKYCHKFLHDDGTVDYYELTPEDMFHRLAKEYARAGMKYSNPLTEEEIFDLFNHYKYIFPQGRPLTGIGTDDAVSISNCFVVGYPDYDSYGTILAEDEEMTHIFRRGGGCIEEHQEVITNRGIIPIKDVAIGDEVLSFNIKTNEVEVQRVQNKYLADVKLEEQIKITYDNGTVLRTSVKHPVLLKTDDGWKYENQLSGELDGSINYYTEPTDEIVYGEEEPLDNDLHVVYNEGIFTLYRGKAKKEYHRVFNEGNTAVVSIEPDNDGKYVYWDIEVENNFNYFAGNNGFVVIHNCGVDISHYRPKNSKVHNAAMTSSGPVEICAKRFSNTVREVGQCIEEHQNVLTPDGLKEIKDVEVGDKVWTEKGFIEVINKYDNGIKPVYKVLTDSWYHITATENHTFLYTEDGETYVEKQLGDFKKGDKIGMLSDDKKYYETFLGLEYEGDKQVYDIELADEHLFWCEGFYVHNSGRRAALMVSMDITHPDAEEFIDAKTNSTEITGANISVKIYDDWMNSFVDNPNPNKENERLWKKIIHNAWQWAEPGVLFWDTIIRESVPDCYEKYGFKTLSTNPCQPACAPVLTKDGLSTIGEIKVGDEIWSEKGWVKVINKVSNGLKEAFAYRTTCGTIYSTENHHVLYKGEYVEIKDTKYVDALNGDESDFEVVENKEMVLNGLVLGSGIVQEKTPSHLILYDASSEDDIILEGEEYGEYFGDIHWENDEYGYEVSGHTIAPEEIRNRVRDKFLPERFKHLSKSDTCNFLKGLFSSIGDYDKAKNRIRIEYINEDFANDIALLLYSVGITSRINKDKGDFMIRITLDAERYMKYIGFIQPEKAEKVMKLETPWGGRRLEPALVYGKKSLGEVEVYDITVDSILHTYWSAGHNISNCGEIPLSAKDSCRLMGLNLYSYVVNPFSKDAYFDFDLLKKHSRLIMKLMDNMIDLEVEKVDLIIDKVKSDPEPEEIKGRELKLWQDIREIALKGRRSGIGFTGEGDMLAALGYKYGTQEATDFAVKVQKTIAENTYIESCLLVQEEGREKFPVFDYELEKDNPFLNRLADGCEEFAKLWRNGKGRRNIANLTCAPVGSLSTQTQTTSGIEPLFMPFYFRKRKIEKAEGIKPDFIDETGDWFEEYFVCHHKYIVWYSVYKGISFDEAKKELTSMKKSEMDEVYKKSPYYQATANDVNWVEKVRMQGGIQKYLDHSISCCLLPDTLIETTDGLYYLDELTDFSTLNEGEFRVNESFEPEAITMNGEKHKITRFYNNGEKDTFLVKLLNGSYVECTSNERLYVLNEETGLYEWKQVSDLKEGEFVKVKH